MPQPPTAAEIDHAARLLTAGRLVAFPTETVYGLGANALDTDAVARIYSVKRRPPSSPLIVHVDSIEMAQSLVTAWPESAGLLARKFWPGPLTLVFHSAPQVLPEVTGGSGKIGIRIPRNLFCIRLSELAGCPLTSTSANISGEAVPETVQDIERSLGAGVDLFIDAGVLPRSLPSTVVDVAEGTPRLVREGVIPFEDLQRIVPTILR